MYRRIFQENIRKIRHNVMKYSLSVFGFVLFVLFKISSLFVLLQSHMCLCKL